MLTPRPTQCVQGWAQASCRTPVTVNVLTPTLDRVRCFKHLYIRCFWGPAPALVVPCSPGVRPSAKWAGMQVCDARAAEPVQQFGAAAAVLVLVLRLFANSVRVHNNPFVLVLHFNIRLF